MTQNDIYNSKARYENFKANLKNFLEPPTADDARKAYYCKNAANLKYFNRLFEHFEARDSSYIRRLRLLMTMRLTCFATQKDLKTLDRRGVDEVIAYMNTRYDSPKTKSDFIRDIKYLWKILFPENDEKGRPDETIMPYPVRHLSPKIDKSQERLRKDRITLEEFERIVSYFSGDPRIQAFLTLSLESLGRPQEILYTRIRDVELFDNYAKVWISEHGKEGTGFLQSIDSYPYLIRWLEVHPFQKDKDAFLFVNTSVTGGFGGQMKPFNVNKHLRRALKHLSINKPVTCYSFKRNGVTYKRLRGDSDSEIQKTARWTSSKQLKTYDMSDQEDVLRIQLAKRGLVKDEKFKEYLPEVKTCAVCGSVQGFTQTTCDKCKRPLDRAAIKKQFDMAEKMDRFITFIESRPELKRMVDEAMK